MSAVAIKMPVENLSRMLWQEKTRMPSHQTESHIKQTIRPTETKKPVTTKASLEQKLSSNHLSWLWQQLTKIYGVLFTNKHGLQDNGIWLEILGDLTPRALESGLERLKKVEKNSKFAEFPPNPLQFRALCLAFYEAMNLPGAGTAFDEVCMNRERNLSSWSHPVVAFTASRLTSEFWSITDINKAFELFTPLYTRVCELVKQGHELPETKPLKRVRQSGSRQVGQQHLMALKKHLETKATGGRQL